MNRKRAIRQLHALRKLGKVMRLAADGWDAEWKTLIATIMSAQTRDETTIPVAEELFRKYRSIRELAGAKVKDVERIIGRVNYHKTKARNIVACCKMLDKEYGQIVPHEFDSLIELPGVGRKTANVFLAECGYRTIGVDTHVHYIANYLGWANTQNRNRTEEQLTKLFPKRYWGELNWILVSFGKTHISRKKKNSILDEVKRMS